mmetsp:Transcript_30100/g.62929  ORF Transcript_30100/g.62929 Transcript_30100/m.62929 type:complete len:106 (-) Transcript_30100:491-808(-)
MLAQARKLGIDIREITSDLAMTALVGNDGYFYAEIMSGRNKKRFLHKTSGGKAVVPLQFGREILAAVLGKPELAHWKSCVASQEEETKVAAEFRESFAKVLEGET